MLSFARPRQQTLLLAELGTELAEHVAWRRSQGHAAAETEDDFSVHEIIPRWRIPRGVDLGKMPLNPQLQQAGWHVQIHYQSQPSFYARANFDDAWDIDWIGESGLARDIAAGIDWLDSREDDLPTSSVRLLSSHIFRFSSFIVDELANRHVVISAASDLRRHLPLLGWLTEEELANHLLEFYGPNYAGGGIANR